MASHEEQGKDSSLADCQRSGGLYAVRQSKEGFVYEKDTVWQKEFEEMFPYEETEDQLSAIEDAKRDMESTRIMDRLICGDGGYAKQKWRCVPHLRKYRRADR